MPNREVFDAEAGRDLIVHDAVGDCGNGAEQNDLRFLHASEWGNCLRIVGRLGLCHGRTAVDLLGDWATALATASCFRKELPAILPAAPRSSQRAATGATLWPWAANYPVG